MKKLILILSAIASFWQAETAAGQATFQKTFGSGTAYSIDKTNDGNLIITGDPMFLLKMDPNGNMLWHSSYSVSANTITGSSVKQTTDGGFIIAGTLNSGTPTSKVALVKTDASGNPLWSKSYGGASFESGSQVKQTLDGGYVVVGSTKSFGIQFDDIYIIKTDGNGNLQWSKNIHHNVGDGVDVGNSIAQLSDSSYVVCGRVGNTLTSSNDAGLIKLNKNGSLQWAKYYGGSGDDGGNSVVPTLDGGYAMTGYTESYGAGGSDVFLVKTTSNGILQWNVSFGGTNYEYGQSIIQSTDGHFIVGGVTQSFGGGMIDYYLNKFDPSGIFVWTKTFGGSGSDWAYSIVERPDRSIFTVGNAPSFSNGIYVVKTDSSGHSGCNEFTPTMSTTFDSSGATTPSILVSSPATVVNTMSVTASSVTTESTLCSLTTVNEVPDQKNIHIFPNPATTEVTIQNFFPGNVQILDMQGQIVLIKRVEEGETMLSLTNFTPAMYTLRYEDEKGRSFFSKLAIIK